MKHLKTLGPVSARLISSLYSSNKTIFSLTDIERITGLKGSAARDLAARLTKREVIARIKPGKFVIIPQEIGENATYIGNWYVIAREIANSPDYYISHYNAMDIHNMLTHPVTKVYITTPIQEYKKQRTIGNTSFEFIYTKYESLWGIQNMWATRSEKVRVSDIGRTIIDCLYRPKYCGGILEIAKGLWIQKEAIDFSILHNYATKFRKFVVMKRLGYILESLRLTDSDYLRKLRGMINNEYYVLDPLLSTQEKYKNSWKLIANISPEAIKKSTST